MNNKRMDKDFVENLQKQLAEHVQTKKMCRYQIEKDVRFNAWSNSSIEDLAREYAVAEASALSIRNTLASEGIGLDWSKEKE